MLSFERRTLLLTALALPLAACGFTPVYKAGSAARALRGKIHFDLISSEDGFILLEQLEKEFGRAGTDAAYLGKLTLSVTEETLSLNSTTSLDRITLIGKATIAVTNQSSGKVVFEDTLSDVAGFSNTSETAASMASRRAAQGRLIRSLGDKISQRLTSTASRWMA